MPVSPRLLVLVLCLVLPLVSACFREPDPAELKAVVEKITSANERDARAMQRTLKVGERLNLADGVSLSLDGLGQPGSEVTPEAGRRLLLLRVTVANKGGNSLDFNPNRDFWMTDIVGHRYEPVVVNGLPSAKLEPGTTASGTLTFAVYTDARDFRFAWQQQPMIVYIVPES